MTAPRHGCGFVAAMAVALVVALGPVQAAGAAPTTDGPPPAASAPASAPAFDRLSDCLQTSGRLLVVFLIDESRSLNQTDGDGERFTGLKATIRGFERLSATAVRGRQPQVQALFTGFADGYTRYGDWLSIGERTDDQVDAAISDMQTHPLTLYTNYDAALEGARHDLGEHAAELTEDGGGQPCKAVVWFTDGRYEVGDGTEAARQALCAPDGAPDDLHRDGVSLFTVALASHLDPADAAYLEAATVGQSGTVRCGSRGSVDNGLYVAVPDPNDLQFYFCCIGSPTEIVTGSSSFTTVEGLGSFLLNVSTGSPDVGVELQPPLGRPVRLGADGPRSVAVGGADLRQEWFNDRSLEAEGTLPPGDTSWVGEWSVNFLGQGAPGSPPPRWTVRLVPGLEPRLVEPDRFVIGEPARLVATVVDQGGNPASGPLLEASRVVAVVRDPVTGEATEVDMHPAGPGRLEGTFTTPDDTSATELVVALQLELDAEGSVDVTPIRRTVRVPTRLPAEFLHIEPPRLELDTLTGDGSAEATFDITGGIADGCLWLDGHSSITGPPEAGAFRITSEPAAHGERSCLHVPARQHNQITVELDPEDYGLGRADGSIVFAVTSDRVPRTRLVSVPVTFSMRPPPCVACGVGIAVVLFVVGLAVPVALLHWLNRRGARFATPGLLMVATTRVAIAANGTVSRSESSDDLFDEVLAATPSTPTNGEGQLLTFRDFRSLQLGADDRSVRRIQVDTTLELRAFASGNLRHRTLSLFSGPYGEATASGDPLFGGAPAGHLRTWAGHTAQELPLALRDAWIFVPDPGVGSVPVDDDVFGDIFGPSRGVGVGGGAVDEVEPPAATGTLYAFAVPGGDPAQYERVGRAAAAALGDLLGPLHDVGRQADRSSGVDAWLGRLAFWRKRRGPKASRSDAADPATLTEPPPPEPGEFDDLLS